MVAVFPRGIAHGEAFPVDEELELSTAEAVADDALDNIQLLDIEVLLIRDEVDGVCGGEA